MDERERRIGANEVLFREINESIEGFNRALETISKRMLIVCECGRQDCLEQIELSLSDYEALRADPTLFAIQPGHDFPEVEDVVDKRDVYWIVQKRPGEPARLAEATDTRG